MTTDIAWRLQQMVAGWRGVERGQPVSALHQECLNAAGVGGRHLLPVHLLMVSDLDETNLRSALRRANGRLRGTEVRFRARTLGRFDAVLVPTGTTGELPDRWLMAIEEHLPLHEQVALYAHALGHLLLNREQQKLDRLPPLEPGDGFAHHDTLAELRLFESVRQRVDRRVLETYPSLSALLREPEEPVVPDASLVDVRQWLAQSGWRGQRVATPYTFTNGRVYIQNDTAQHGKKLRVDALLRAEQSLPIAIAQTIHAGQAREAVIQRLIDYAHSRLLVPFAYLLEDDGTVLEFDWTTDDEVRTVLAALPDRDTLFNRWIVALGLNNQRAMSALVNPYQLSGPMPRYYQEAAINRAIIAVLQAQRELRPKRILLTLATGTGKTKVAFQLVWKLKRARAVRNVLFLTDRDFLLGQAMDNEFAPFGYARTRILGTATTSRDIVFATYQAIADSQTVYGLYHDYPRDFFDVVIVDECHRGSAQADSSWRAILEYFNSAVQIGLTATPLNTDDVQTDDYFGRSLYTYSLRTGINDGFLAPYRVRHVLMGNARNDGRGESDSESGQASTDNTEIHAADKNDATGAITSSNEEESFDLDENGAASVIIEESAGTLIARTEPIAQHLAAYLKQSDPLAKTIVFCVDQAHAERMRLALRDACADEVARYSDYVERIVSDEGNDGRRALGRFGTPADRTPVIVTTSRLLSTGVDIPTCKNIVLARPVRSLVEFKQIIGRGSRLYEPEKTWFTIIDYAGAINRFFDPDFDGDPELVEIEVLTPHLQPVSEPVTSEHDVQEEKGGQDGQVHEMSETDVSVGDTGGTFRSLDNGNTVQADDVSPEPPEPVGVAQTPGQPVESGAVTSVEISYEVSPASEEYDIRSESEEDTIPVVNPVQDSIPTSSEHSERPGTTSSTVDDANVSERQVHEEGASFSPAEDTPASAQVQPDPPSVITIDAPPSVQRTRSGQIITVIGEFVYDLGPDGKTLYRRGAYRDFATTALRQLVGTPEDLYARWLHREQRDALKQALTDEGIDLETLAEALHLSDFDAFDILRSVAFSWQPLTRAERVEQVYREHKDFFNTFNTAAREMLHTILEKYEAGEAQDVSDTDLLKVPPLSERGTFMELAQSFGGGTQVREALRKLQQLLYIA